MMALSIPARRFLLQIEGDPGVFCARLENQDGAILEIERWRVEVRTSIITAKPEYQCMGSMMRIIPLVRPTS